MRAAALAIALTACGDDAMPGEDASVDADAPSAFAPEPPIEPMPPGAPMPVLLPAWDCPTGWRAIELEGGAPACDPFPASGRADCAANEAHLPGRPGCERIAPRCGEVAIPSGAIHVRAGATSGDGSAASPFGTIGQALAAASAGGTIYVDAGSYPEALRIERAVTIVGRCPDEVSIELPDVRTFDASADLVVRNATIGPVQVTAGSTTLEGVRVRSDRGRSAIFAEGGALRVVHTIVEGPVTGAAPRGVAARGTATLVLSQVVIERMIELGAGIAGEARGTIEDSVIASVASAGGASRGIQVQETASLTASRVVVLDTVSGAVQAFGEGARADLTDVLVDGVMPGPVSETFFAIGAQYGTLNARQIHIANATETGFFAQSGAHVEIDRIVVEHTVRGGEGHLPVGLGVMIDGSTATVAHAFASNFVGYGFASQGDAHTDLSDVVTYRSTYSDGLGAAAMVFWPSSSGTVSRYHAIEVSGDALAVRPGTSVVATDIDVESSRTVPDGTTGGVGVDNTGGTLDLTRLRVRHPSDAALLVSDGSTHVRDLIVEDDLPLRETTQGGVFAQHGAHLTLERAHVEGARYVGIGAVDEETVLDASDLSILGSRATETENGLGTGVVIARGAVGTIARARVQRSFYAEIYVGVASRLDATDLQLGGSTSTYQIFGRCLESMDRSHVTIARALFDDCRGIAGIAAYDSTLDVRDVVIRGTRPACQDDCDPSLIASSGFYGLGIVSIAGGTVTMRDFLVERSALCGIALGPMGTLDVADGTIRDNPIGLCVDGTTYDPASAVSVSFDNDQNLSSQTLPVPEPDSPVAMIAHPPSMAH